MAAWIARHGLLRGHERVLVAVSGGADSVALLRVLCELRGALSLTITVAHVHHGVRGVNADADQQFAESLARELGLPCVTERLEPSAGDEAGLREARYDRLLAIARRCDADCIAVGHTLDDQAETVLMRIVRGTGLDGLQGIPAERGIQERRLIRPLRGVTRAAIEAWLRAIGQTWRDDETNAETDRLRNQVRHELLPLLTDRYNPQIRTLLCQLAETAAAVCDEQSAAATRWLTAYGSDDDGALRWPITLWQAQPAAMQQAILREALRRVQGHARQWTFQHWQEIVELSQERPAGSVVDLPGGVQLRKTAEAFVLTVCQPVSFEV